MTRKGLIRRKTKQPTFPEGISTKGDVIGQVEFELAYFETGSQQLTHYATGTHSDR